VYAHTSFTTTPTTTITHPPPSIPHVHFFFNLKKVMRVWFDQQLSGVNGTIDILETPDFAPVNLIAQYHLLEEECAAWANATGGACVRWEEICVCVCVCVFFF
jgi:hypothetical protein